MRVGWSDLPLDFGDATWLWQDLDGVHTGSIPASPPLTSILWGWWPGVEGKVARMRLDDDTAFVAVRDWPQNASTVAIPWDSGDGRVATAAGLAPKTVGIKLAMAVLDGMTFVRPEA